MSLLVLDVLVWPYDPEPEWLGADGHGVLGVCDGGHWLGLGVLGLPYL